MRGRAELDAVVVGAGPNGLAAAVTLARAGLGVRVYERLGAVGGGTATSELTLPGFRHDVCSAVHPLALASPFFREFGLGDRIDFAVPEISFAHPLDGGRAGVAYRDLERTVDGLGRDGAAYRALLGPLVAASDQIADFTTHPLVRVPPHIVAPVRFGLAALSQSGRWWNTPFVEDAAPSMITGVSAHTILPLPSLASAAAGLALTTYAHARGWPIPIGGSQAIADALADDLVAHGGEIVTDAEITSLDELPPARTVLLDVTPAALVRLAGPRMPDAYRRRLERFRYGNGVLKVDFALSGPVPWTNEAVRRAGTVHVGGTRAEVAAAENVVARGGVPERPYVLVAQPSTFDDSRAPDGMHTLWTYTHVPAGSSVDTTEAVVAQIERFAPGFRDLIVATSTLTAVDMEQHNPNYPGGDIAAGLPDVRQLLGRPTISTEPWRTAIPGVYLCGASTSPGPGVHGMAGWLAARSALRHEFGTRILPHLAP